MPPKADAAADVLSPDTSAPDGSADASCLANVATDPTNCGRCGHNCAGGACQGGKCQPQTLASNENEIDQIAVNATHVYWVSYDTHHVARCALPSCSGGPQILATGIGPTIGIAVDTTSVYWSDWGKGVDPGAVRKCLLPDCSAPPITIATGQYRPNEIAINNTTIYWGSFFDTTVKNASLGAVDAAGTNIATGQAGGLTRTQLAGGNVYWLVMSQSASGAIRYCPLTGCNAASPPSLVEGLNTPSGLAIDGQFAYWASTGSQQILKCALPNCTGGPTVVLSGQAKVQQLLVDAGRLYWTVGSQGGQSDGVVATCTLPACSDVSIIASNLVAPTTLVASADSLYFNANGGLIALAKP